MTDPSSAPKRVLSLFDSVSIMLGIIIGVGIYETSGSIAQQVGSSNQLIALWLAGGVISLCGALVYAELASALPREGGEACYLARAFGPRVGFLFAWAGLLIIRPGSIAAMAFPFAHYTLAGLSELSGLEAPPGADVGLAAAAVVVFTALSCWRFQAGTWTQNLLTAVKVCGLALLIAAPFVAATDPGTGTSSVETSIVGINLALVLIIFTYGGWNELGYVAAEVRDHKTTIPRSIVWTVLISTALYVLVTLSFVYLLGMEGLAASSAPATDALNKAFPSSGGAVMSVLVAISALGALNGLIITSARIAYTLGSANRAFAFLSRWSPRANSPQNALLTQMLVCLLIIYLTGSFVGTVVYTTAVVWLFFSLTGAAYFVLRIREPDLERPYKTPGHPVVPALFLLTSLYVAYSALAYDFRGSLIALGVVATGLPVYYITSKRMH